jgi:hypothetical protein
MTWDTDIQYRWCEIWYTCRGRKFALKSAIWYLIIFAAHSLDFPKSAVRGSWKRRTFVTRMQARQIRRCIFAPVTLANAHYYSVLTTTFDMVNAHYVIIDFRAKFFIKIQNQASDTSRSLPSFSSAPFLLRAAPSERLGQVYPFL